MATNAQRAQAICDAVINGVATQVQMVRLADAIAREQSKDPVLMTLAQKAELIVSAVRSYCIVTMKRTEGDAAAKAATITAGAGVDTSFAESP